MNTGHVGAQVSYQLGREVVKAQDTKQPLGPFASNSENLSCQQQPGFPEATVVSPSFVAALMRPKLGIPQPSGAISLSFIFPSILFLKK